MQTFIYGLKDPPGSMTKIAQGKKPVRTQHKGYKITYYKDTICQ